MTTLKVNGHTYQCNEEKSLLRFLRDDLRLTSVKDGCSEGACGTCTVLIDGKPVKCCVQKISKMDGKEIITVEGLSDREKEVFSYAFARCGAVQCGFCIPGMVISAKALIDQNPDPSRIEAAFAIRNNICRCTGYRKIIDGILLSAKIFRENLEIPDENLEGKIGDGIRRIDAKDKVLGRAQFTDDIYLDGMIYGKAVRSAFPRARVLSIHTEKAKALPGVIAVFTAEDIPGENKIGHIKHDWDTMIPVGMITHYLGDAIALVAAETQEICDQAVKLVEVEYEELPFVDSPQKGLEKDAPLVHRDGNIQAYEHLVRGDAAAMIAASKYKVTRHYETPFTEHAFLEPETAVAFPFDKDGVFIYSSDQSTHTTSHECAMMLGLPPEKVVVANKFVGGGFGGKEDLTVQHHAALIAYLTKRPVKVKLTRKESMLIHPKRHPMSIDMTTACDENGIITAIQAKVISDTGAYASLGGPVLQRACTHAAGPYNYQVIDIEGTAVYTNNPPSGAFRGFGVTQTCFASERNLDLLAEMVGISPWEIRYRNAIRPGQVLPNGQIADESTSLVETLEAVKDIYENNKIAGIACALKNAGVGVGLPDWGRAKLVIREGKVHFYSGATCMGQGLATTMLQILEETLHIGLEKLVYHFPNSFNSPDSGVSSGSRQTLVTGEAARRAAEQLFEDLKTHSLEELEGKEYHGAYLAKTDPMGSAKPNPVSHVAYGYATQVCVLNEDGTVKELVGAHGLGKAVNPINVEGQIEGGLVMGMGYALTENFKVENCNVLSKYGTLGLMKADKVPELHPIIVEKKGTDMAYGAIGIGEITCIPTAPAIAGAYYKWDGEFRTELPLAHTPYRKS